MKTSVPLILTGLILLSSLCHGQQRLKIATVSMEKLFNEYYRTEKIQRESNIERARIQRENNNRLSDIRKIEARLQEIREALSDEELGEKQRNDLKQEGEALTKEGRSKEDARKRYITQRTNALSTKVREQMQGVLAKIQRAVSETAKRGNYDFIFDSSGNSNTGIPFVLNARETTDLTDLLLKEINGETE